MTRDTGLLPCPFCGAEPPNLHLSHITGRIFCEGCGAEGPWSPAFDGDWNTRAHPVQEPPSPGVTAGATGGDAAERKRRKNIVDHYAQMMDAQAQCVPCRLCGGKAVITDAGPGFGYTIECENAARFRKPTCLQSGTRISGWAYNVSDLWNRLNATPAPVVPAEGLADYDAGLLNDFGGGNVEWWQDYLRAEIGRANEHWRVQAQDLCERRAAMLGDFAEWTADDITALRSAPPVGARVSIPSGLIDALRSQRQIDADGCEVAVSRQACDEAAAILAALLPAG